MIGHSFDLQVMAAVLRWGRTLDGVSRGLATLTLLWWILRQVHGQDASPVWTSVIALGLVLALMQLYWAMRVGLDAELLTALGQRKTEDSARDLDASLVAVGLRSAMNIDRERGWHDRWRAMRGMLLRQLLCVFAQLAALVAAGWVG